MARNMQKWIDEYYKECEKNRKASAAFLIDDVLQMTQIVEKKGGIATSSVLNAIFDSLAAGWIIGYRAGQRDAKRRQKNGAGGRQKRPRTKASDVFKLSPDEVKAHTGQNKSIGGMNNGKEDGRRSDS